MDSICFPQFLLNNGRISAKDAAKLLPLCKKGMPAMAEYEEDRHAYKKIRQNPVNEVVLKLCGGDLAEEAAIYADYMQLFVESMVEYMSTPAVIEPKIPVLGDGGKELNAVSQRMDGDVSLVPGIMAGEREFLTLAERMSGEELNEIDDLAIDSLQEFINVVNGVFSIKMAERGLEVELEAPRAGKIIAPNANKQVLLSLFTGFGSFFVVLSADEFM